MIPIIGWIISSYICFRAAETWFLAPSRYAGVVGRVVMIILSVLLLLFVLGGAVDLLFTSSSMPAFPMR